MVCDNMTCEKCIFLHSLGICKTIKLIISTIPQDDYVFELGEFINTQLICDDLPTYLDEN